jgi:hypothetical protein
MIARLKAFWGWLKKYWAVPLIILGIIGGWLLFRKRREKGTPIVQTKVELQAIDAAGQARLKEAELGAEKAKAWVEAQYQSELQALNQSQKEQADALRDNPAELAKFLVRAGSGQ